MKASVLAVLMVLASVPVYAQTGAPTSYTFRVFQSGTLVGQPLTVSSTQVLCDLAPNTGSNVNPTRWRWNDPARAGRECELPDATRLAALPDGDYSGTIAAANADGSSAETAAIPFVRRRPNPPSVPTGAKVIQ